MSDEPDRDFDRPDQDRLPPRDVRASVARDHGAAERAIADDGKAASGGGRVDVHFDGKQWCVEDDSLDHPLAFEHLADAEQRAAELGKDHGRGVCVRGQEGDVIASYEPHVEPPDPSMR